MSHIARPLGFATALALVALSGVGFAEDPPKKDEEPKTGSPSKPVEPSGPIQTKTNAGDVNGTISKVGLTQITLKIPQQVPNGFKTVSTRVPVVTRPGHPPTYHTVQQQVPQFKTVQNEMDFAVGDSVKVTTETGRVVDFASLKAGMPAVLHLTRVKEGRWNEKGDAHLEVTAILVPNASVPVGAVDPAKKSK